MYVCFVVYKLMIELCKFFVDDVFDVVLVMDVLYFDEYVASFVASFTR